MKIYRHISPTGVIWYVNEKNLYHREDGPAIIYTDGSTLWCRNGKNHRIDGPAVEYCNGYRAWYVHGVKLTEEEHKRYTTKLGKILYS
jgi:hypothetical protein